MLQFFTTWLFALRVILELIAESDIESMVSRSPRWKGDVAIRKADGEVILILSALLMEEERRLLKVSITTSFVTLSVVLFPEKF